VRYSLVSVLVGLFAIINANAADELNIGHVFENTPTEIWIYYLFIWLFSISTALFFYKSVKGKHLGRIIESILLCVLLILPIGVLFNEDFQVKLDNNAMSYEVSVFLTYLAGMGIVAIGYFITRILLGFFGSAETREERQANRVKAKMDEIKTKKAERDNSKTDGVV